MKQAKLPKTTGPKKTEPKQYTVHEAKTHLSKILKKVEGGAEAVIARGREPIARLIPISSKFSRSELRGIDKGKIWMASDFNESISPEFFIGKDE